MAEIERVRGHLIVDDLKEYNASFLRELVEGTLRCHGLKFSRAEKKDKHGKKIAIYIPQRINERDRWPTIHIFNRPQRLEEWAEDLDMAELIKSQQDISRCKRIALLKGRHAKGVPEHYPAADVWNITRMIGEQMIMDYGSDISRGYKHFLFDNGLKLISSPDSYHDFSVQMDSACMEKDLKTLNL